MHIGITSTVLALIVSITCYLEKGYIKAIVTYMVGLEVKVEVLKCTLHSKNVCVMCVLVYAYIQYLYLVILVFSI